MTGEVDMGTGIVSVLADGRYGSAEGRQVERTNDR